MNLSFEKTHFILFVNYKSVKNHVIKIKDDVIERVKVIFLGHLSQ